ncbi:MAG: hypothetical protein FWG74_09415, partial [Planctomycetes bacterium]|nr:hypothetical protein [Planctomycetota bacterium]
MPQAIFVEQQQFRQSHLWIPLVVLFVVVLGVQLYVIRGREQVHAAQWAGLVLSLAVFLSVGLLLYLAKLEVMVEPGVLKFRM